MLSKIDITTPFSEEINGKQLTINFSGILLEDRSASRTVCASFSYLLLQMLKRKMRKKLRGFKLRLNPKGQETEPESTSTPATENTTAEPGNK